MKLRFKRRSGAPLRATPVLEGARPPKPGRAEVAGFTGRAGQSCELVGRKRRHLLLGVGPLLDDAAAEAAGALAVAKAGKAAHLALDARGLRPQIAAGLLAGASLRAWRTERYRSKPDPDAGCLERIDVLVDDPEAARAAWAPVAAGVEGALLARDLVTEPSNTLTPLGFAGRLDALRQAGVEIEVLHADRLQSEGFGALLAVGGGSANPPCLVVLRWPGVGGAAPVAFVGKGITFDTGGICVKPADRMWEMRADMAGAAACAGAMLALALRRSPAPAVAVLALAENAFGERSYRPGDVLRTVGGVTVEVIDTDAEGRLALADALAWTAARFQPLAMIDLATLTGSIIVALGHHKAGLFDNDAALAAHVAAAGAAVGELAWRMPIGEAHREALRSDIADLRHCAAGTRQPDACQAAAFLREFVGAAPWVHLDIAGVEVRERACDRHAAGATGFGVRLLDRLVAARFEDPSRG